MTELSEHLRKFPAVDGRLISNELDSPVRANVFQKSWRRAVKVAGATGIRYHDPRHFYVYASALISAGCSVVAVQHALGHASATETLNTYAHL